MKIMMIMNNKEIIMMKDYDNIRNFLPKTDYIVMVIALVMVMMMVMMVVMVMVMVMVAVMVTK